MWRIPLLNDNRNHHGHPDHVCCCSNTTKNKKSSHWIFIHDHEPATRPGYPHNRQHQNENILSEFHLTWIHSPVPPTPTSLADKRMANNRLCDTIFGHSGKHLGEHYGNWQWFLLATPEAEADSRRTLDKLYPVKRGQHRTNEEDEEKRVSKYFHILEWGFLLLSHTLKFFPPPLRQSEQGREGAGIGKPQSPCNNWRETEKSRRNGIGGFGTD